MKHYGLKYVQVEHHFRHQHSTSPVFLATKPMDSGLESSVASSLSLSRSLPHLIDNDVDTESVSEAGDIGDRSLRRRHSVGRSSRLSADDFIEQGTNDTSRQEQDVLHDLRALNTASLNKPLPADITASPLPTKSLLSPEINNPVETIFNFL